MNTYEEYKAEDQRLKKELKKADAKNAEFRKWTDENLHKPYEYLTEEQREAVREHIKTFNWESITDAIDNLEGLIFDNYRRFVSWSADLEPRRGSKCWMNERGLPEFTMN